MKKLIAICVIVVLLFSCDEDRGYAEYTLRVKENKVSCTGVGVMDCYLVQEGNKIGTPEWEYFYDQINGFQFEPGFRYDLLVAKERVANPPMDASKYKYSLLKVLSKEQQ